MSIEVRHISKTFGTFKALDDVSLTVQTGELLALLGPSGSGKTTLLRIIAGLEQADDGSGSILFHGEDVSGRPVRERGVGFVFQHYALFRHMTVLDNVAFGLRVKPWRRRPSRQQIRDRVMELLKLVQLDGLAGRYPHQLSGGQRQRVALARALAVQPKVLLLDEPFGALDAKVRQELRTWLRRLHDEIHVTSVFVTHDQDEALEVADRVVVMNTGRIEQVGTPDEVFHKPRTEFVMNFLGQVNQFPGHIEQGQVAFGSGVAGQPARAARIFVRPHEFDLETTPHDNTGIEARINRIHSAGATVRLELVSLSGQPLSVELSQDRFRALRVQPGQMVFATPRDMRVFADDYQI
jgi:sulfate transport system ATP-binding protein